MNFCKPTVRTLCNYSYPILVVSSHGTIAVYLREACIVEMTVNKTIRVECAGKFSAATNSFGSSNCILHPDCRILQQDTRVQCLFGKNKVASFGPQVYTVISKTRLLYNGNGCLIEGYNV